MKPFRNLYIVDDDDIFVLLTNHVIKESNLFDNIQSFKNGKDAIDHLQQITTNEELLPEVIFLDLWMPVLDGWRFLEEYITIKPKIDKKINIYIVSSSVNPLDIERAKKASEVTGYIIKPVSKSHLSDIVKNYFA